MKEPDKDRVLRYLRSVYPDPAPLHDIANAIQLGVKRTNDALTHLTGEGTVARRRCPAHCRHRRVAHSKWRATPPPAPGRSPAVPDIGAR